MNESVTLMEVSPRDGLQNESTLLSTQDKLKLIDHALDAGFKRVEVASFVHPTRVPQMADAEAVCAGLPHRADVTYTGLVLNWRGYERALATGQIDEIGMVVTASDAFGRKNQGQTMEEGIAAGRKILADAKRKGIKAQVTIAVSFGCPFEGEVPIGRVAEMAKRLAEADPVEIALADTIGVGVPTRVMEAFDSVREAIGTETPLRAHFHDTRNTGIANAFAAMQVGVETLDASIGGIGGCPFAPNATGNIATEDLVYMLDRMQIAHGASLERLLTASQWLSGALGKPLPSMVSRAGGFPVGEGHR